MKITDLHSLMAAAAMINNQLRLLGDLDFGVSATIQIDRDAYENCVAEIIAHYITPTDARSPTHIEIYGIRVEPKPPH
jgi:hypothetical protein